MKYYLLCDCRENFENCISSIDSSSLYNDHPSQKNLYEILNSMKELGYNCEYFGGIPQLIHAVDNSQSITLEDCRFINFTDGMDQCYSRVQAPVLLDILGLPYSGSGVFASVLMNNKHYCKQALLSYGINMPKSYIINKFIPFTETMIQSWNYPIFIKPNCEGSSLGISNENVCHTYSDLCKMVSCLLNQYDEVIIEEYVYGIDVTNYLIGNPDNYLINEVIVSELYDSSPWAVYGMKEKSNKLRTLYFNDEKLDITTIQQIKKTSIQIAKIIGVNDICRIDYRYDYNKNEFYFLEINSAPRFSSSSEIGFIAQKKNLSFPMILDKFLCTFNSRIDNKII
ncbi:MAG: hypothetical protein NC231_02600 [Bacillus sp. (in: Bacteria)]|nr:hypothetical protein [Bacillus sp. (in: firmicutes)]